MMLWTYSILGVRYGQSHAISCRTATTLRFFAGQLLLLQGSRIRGSSTACAVPRSSLEEQLQFTLDHLGILLDPALMASRCAECNADKFRLASAEEVSSELHASTIERYSVSLLQVVPESVDPLHCRLVMVWLWGGGGLIRVPEGSCCSTRSIMPPVSVNEESTCNWHLWVAMSTLGSRIVIHRMLTHVIVAAWFTDLFGLDMLEWRFESPKTVMSIHFSQFYDPRSSGVVAAAGNSTGKVVPGVVPCARLVLDWGSHRRKVCGWRYLEGPPGGIGWLWCAVPNWEWSPIHWRDILYIYISIIHTIFWPWHIWYPLRGMGVFSSMETAISGL